MLRIPTAEFRMAHNTLQRYGQRPPKTLLIEAARRLFDEAQTKPEDRNAIIRAVADLVAEFPKLGPIAGFELVCWGYTVEAREARRNGGRHD